MTLPFMISSVALVLLRPRLAACVALASFAWFGWTECGRGSIVGLITALTCGVLYTAICLKTCDLEPGRVEGASIRDGVRFQLGSRFSRPLSCRELGRAWRCPQARVRSEARC